MYKSFK